MASDNKIIELIKQGDIAAFNTLLFIQGYTERMPQLPSFYRNSLSD